MIRWLSNELQGQVRIRRKNDIHNGLKIEPIDHLNSANVEFHLGRVVHGKDEFALGIHATSFMGGGPSPHPLEYLGRLGFEQQQCTFTKRNPSLCLATDDDADFREFGEAFSRSYEAFIEAKKHLERCGFYLQDRDIPATRWARSPGDGHTGTDQKQQRESEDENFRFRFTSLKQGGNIGWTTHYRVKDGPISPEMRSVLHFLEVNLFDTCPEFDFESCHWRHIILDSGGGRFFDANASSAYGWFDAHTEHFSLGIEHLLTANLEMERFGLAFLPSIEPATEPPTGVMANVGTPDDAPTSDPATSDFPEEFDVAISFAGAQRDLAEQLANEVRSAGFNVFYDNFYQHQLWGKHLTEFFDDIFRNRSRHCVMFISPDYRDRIWTTHERRSALARSVEQKGGEYILPIVVEPTDIEGLPSSIAYLSLAERSIDEIAEMLIEKLRQSSPPTN